MEIGAFETARCRLSPVHAAEVMELHHLLAEPEVRLYLCDDQILGVDRVTGLVERSSENFRERGIGLWTVRDGPTGSRAGLVGFAEFSAPGALELMYAMRPRFWGRGLATEVARAAMERGFASGLSEIHASTDEPNSASRRVLARLGFREVHRKPADPPRTIWPQVYFVAPAPGSPE